jgi:RNA recognition motif-containing protein
VGTDYFSTASASSKSNTIANHSNNLFASMINASKASPETIIDSKIQRNHQNCAIFVRNIPPNVSSEDLKGFLQKRIQLAFKVLCSDIKIPTCFIFEREGKRQAFLEFEERRHAEFSLALKKKTFINYALKICPWENRFSFDSCDDEDEGKVEKQTAIDQKGHAVYINNLPVGTSSESLKTFLMEMMKIAYKEAPTIVACSVRPSPQNDAYGKFNTPLSITENNR